MIGVLCNASDDAAAEEFFQLFKTPWERWRSDHQYDVLIVTRSDAPAVMNAGVIVVYNSCSTTLDRQIGVAVAPSERGHWLGWNNLELPIYGEAASLAATGHSAIGKNRKCEVVGLTMERRGQLFARLGVDLFAEVRYLLDSGQPADRAHIPTLDLHIGLLRTLITSAGIPLIEIPPAPPGYCALACLTHDVDFVGIRDHRGDSTMWGFLYRCLWTSTIRTLRGTLGWEKCYRNWRAALSLPLVHLGLLKDFWLEFERYAELERGLGSTFFLIPFKSVAGERPPGSAPARRAAKYDLVEIRSHIAGLLASGCEVGLHGINAWLHGGSSIKEGERVHEVTGTYPRGVRMHWLYWGKESAALLEAARFTYDSTSGYNDAVGFRAGTTQPFRPLGVERLMELPLNIQDSALFYPDRMGLSEEDAFAACHGILSSTSLLGGAVTVNWHTRSLSPERLWGEFYERLLNGMRTHGFCFGSAQEVVSWFDGRRALRFDAVQFSNKRVQVRLTSQSEERIGPFTLRVYHPGTGPCPTFSYSPFYTDARWDGQESLEIEL